MKVTIILGALAFSVDALASVQYQQASRFVPRLAPRVADAQESTKTLITRDDTKEKNFTFDELFTLQKGFLDNFISPNNVAQVRSFISKLRPPSTDTYLRLNQSTLLY